MQWQNVLLSHTGISTVSSAMSRILQWITNKGAIRHLLADDLDLEICSVDSKGAEA